jgi:hypothetical protein
VNAVVVAAAAEAAAQTIHEPAVEGVICPGLGRPVPVPLALTLETSNGVVVSTLRNTMTAHAWPSAIFPCAGIVIDVSGVEVIFLYETCIEESYVTAVVFNCVPSVEYPEMACAVFLP